MSDKFFEGAIRVERLDAIGMITLRGDFRSSVFASALKDAAGSAVPDVREVLSADETTCAWMSPDELLLVIPSVKVESALNSLSTALDGEHHLAENVSDARAVFRLTGQGAREVLAKGAPVDLSKEAFGRGAIRRTRLGQVAVAFWMSGEDQFDLVCFRSVGDFVFDWLSMASRERSLPEYL